MARNNWYACVVIGKGFGAAVGSAVWVRRNADGCVWFQGRSFAYVDQAFCKANFVISHRFNNDSSDDIEDRFAMEEARWLCKAGF